MPCQCTPKDLYFLMKNRIENQSENLDAIRYTQSLGQELKSWLWGLVEPKVLIISIISFKPLLHHFPSMSKKVMN